MGTLYSARRISRPGEASPSIHSSRPSSEPIGPHDRSEFGLQHLERNSHEVRFILVGLTCTGRLVVVAHDETDRSIRIINACPATNAERRYL